MMIASDCDATPSVVAELHATRDNKSKVDAAKTRLRGAKVRMVILFLSRFTAALAVSVGARARGVPPRREAHSGENREMRELPMRDVCGGCTRPLSTGCRGD
jgi:hypothetical protein